MQHAVELIRRGYWSHFNLMSCTSGKTVRINIPLPVRELNSGHNAEQIATTVASRIEGLKARNAPLEKFSATKHLTKNTPQNGFAPGTPNNPELYSISYSNGVVATTAA